MNTEMHPEFREFIRGVAESFGGNTAEADAQWAAYSRQSSDSDREEIEACGYNRGLEMGREISSLCLNEE